MDFSISRQAAEQHTSALSLIRRALIHALLIHSMEDFDVLVQRKIEQTDDKPLKYSHPNIPKNYPLDASILPNRKTLLYSASRKKKRGALYFHSQIFSEKFPSASISASKSPTTSLRNDNLPVDDVL